MPEERIPFVVLSDAPNLSSGLARIARDLCFYLWGNQGALGIEVSQAGLRYNGAPFPWRVYPVHDEEEWGKKDIGTIWTWATGGTRPGILFSVWDPGRCYGTSEVDLPGCERWGYFAVDSHNVHGKISGPALDALKKYERVLAYGDWGAQVLARSLDLEEVPWLPHGLDTSVFHPRLPKSPSKMIGVVAANQRRKDFGLVFRAVDLLRKSVEGVCLWIHTDQQVTEAWSLPELGLQFDFTPETLMLTTELDDDSLAGLYSACRATIAPGLGEGFGYPIVESLACGTPCVHGPFGGGVDLVPNREWIWEMTGTWRLEGAYAQLRPAYHYIRTARALEMALRFEERMGEEAVAYCQGSVAHLDWKHLWPRWRSWFRQGIKAFREKSPEVAA